MSEAPPIDHPPILLSTNYHDGDLPEGTQLRPSVVIREGRLQISADQPFANEGFAASTSQYRDVIVQARMALTAGDENDMFGLFVRQASGQLYYTFTVSIQGYCVVSQYAGQYIPAVNGLLASDMKFYSGLNSPNLFQVVACGPCLSFILNNMVVAGTMVDPRFKEGYLGFFLHHGNSSPRAELSVDWVQVRAIFPGQQGWATTDSKL